MNPECIGIDRILDTYSVLYGQRDLAGLISLVEPDFQGFGTGPDEVVMSAEELRRAVARDFAQAEVSTIAFTDRYCTVEGTAAWVMGACRFDFRSGETEGIIVARFTAVLRKNEGVWRFAQLHYSMPCSEQAEGSSWPSE